MRTVTFLALSATVGILGIIVIISPETILPVNTYVWFAITGITAVLGGVITWIGIKKRQENIGVTHRALIIFSGCMISLFTIGSTVFILLIYLAD